MNLLLGDCLEKLKDLPDNSVDSVVTDPPYGLSFMGKKWDYSVPSIEIWKEVLRVLKPGGHLLSFAGTRTYHRMAVNIEDAGFEIRDQIMWLYGSGFPKSLNISKALDKMVGAEREQYRKPIAYPDSDCWGIPNNNSDGKNSSKTSYDSGAEKINAGNGTRWASLPSTEAAKQWDGWGTALKPANEPICVARKPLSESTVAKNILKWGVGGINVDASRIGTQDMSGQWDRTWNSNQGELGKRYSQDSRISGKVVPPGRFPANLLLDEEAAAALDAQSGQTRTGHIPRTGKTVSMFGPNNHAGGESNNGYGDSGGASRFFYVAKVSARERGADNKHPTVKPIKLMEYLCRLVTPPGGTCLDPFMGSGSTGIAAKNLGFHFIGIEREAEYHAIAAARIGA